MFQTRPATAADAAAITHQRRRMFLDAGLATLPQADAMAAAFLPWVHAKLAAGQYLGWLTEDTEQAGNTVAGAGLYLMEFPPHWLDPQPVRAYLLNFYVDPSLRGQGLAGQLLRLAVAESRARNIKVVTLHASRFGKPIYEKFGFQHTDEMRWINQLD
jgi:ribosomal protein S18 acetylase RimI-like enzyme